MTTQTTTNSGKAWAPDVTYVAPEDAIPEALIIAAATKGGTVEGDAPSVRVTYVDDDEAQFTAEGAEIPESDPDLSEALVHTSKVTQLVRLSREQYEQAGTAQQIVASMSRAITKKANAALLTQVAPTSPAVAPVAGLLNVSGVVAGDQVTGSLDALIDLYAELESNGATPSHIVLDPLGWAALMKLKKATGSNEGLLGAGTETAEARLLSLPILKSAALTAYSGVLLDRTAIISAYGTIQVATSADAYFTSDSVGVRATWRIGHVVPRANRLGTFTVDDGVA
ncbi:phage major capsid protein [Nocardia nova]|nr:phage major capsid protein [Nocardia nova]